MSNLVDHARRELELLGEDPATIEGLVKVVQAFSDMGHSGGSASIAIPMLTALLEQKNLTPLTSNPDEWIYYAPELWDGESGVWQNKRNSKMFSNDGGNTYYSVDDLNQIAQTAAPYFQSTPEEGEVTSE